MSEHIQEDRAHAANSVTEGGGGQALLSRRQLLLGAGGLAAVAALTSSTGRVTRALARGSDDRSVGALAHRSGGAVRTFRSRPDLLPPAVAVSGAGVAAGYLFLGPGSLTGFAQGSSTRGPQFGPLIVDDRGDVVWFRPLAPRQWATNFRVARYRGEPVLTWWEGDVIPPGYGRGEGVIMDSSYRELARVRAGNGRWADLHEFQLTSEGTALMTCYPDTVVTDLTRVGGPRRGRVLESILQEVDVLTGRVLLEWRSTEHVPVAESYQPSGEPYDHMHANSIGITPDGHLLVSGRATWSLYKLDRRTGEVMWRLGGKRSDYSIAPEARFAWQHDARHVNDGLITLFDNGAGLLETESQSRGLLLDVDERRRSVRLARAYRHPEPLLAFALGSVQILPDGHVFVGWGAQRYASEFAPNGGLLADAHLPSGLFSYRTFRFRWRGMPQDAPAIAARPDPVTGKPIVFASWNGATNVAYWQVLAGPTPGNLQPLGIAARRGFETAIPVDAEQSYAAVTPLDSSRHVLAMSPTVPI